MVHNVFIEKQNGKLSSKLASVPETQTSHYISYILVDLDGEILEARVA